MASADPFKLADPDFDQFQAELISKVTLNQVVWGIPLAEIALLTPKQTRWNAAWLVAKDPDDRSHSEVVEKDEARVEYVKLLRPFSQRWIIRNTLVTDAQRVAMRFKPRDTVRTRVPVPTTIPQIDPKPGSGNQLLFHFRQEVAVPGTSGRGKPKGVKRCEFALKIGDPAPADISECPIRKSVTKSPMRITFDATDAGKRVRGFAWWVNTRDEAGPPTPVAFSVVIPG